MRRCDDQLCDRMLCGSSIKDVPTYRRTFRLTECAVLRESPIACPRCWAIVLAVVLRGPVTKAASHERSLSGAQPSGSKPSDRGLSAVINFCDVITKSDVVGLRGMDC